jgi:hypothetical protein
MATIDWNQAENLLMAETTKALQDFAEEYPGTKCCYFAFDSEPRYGDVLLCFDTTSNSQQSAQRRQQSAIDRRLKMLTGERAWEHASYFLKHPVLVPFGDDTGNFAFIGYREVSFPEWKQFADSTKYPSAKKNADDYLDGNFRILVWKVIERLVLERAFDCLSMSSPFMIGYGIHDQEMSIVRMLNWGNETRT